MSAASISLYEFLLLVGAASFSWAASFTVLWPVMLLLRFVAPLRRRIGSYAWNKYCCPEQSAPLRSRMLDMLRESCPQFSHRKLRILELGTWCDTDPDFYSQRHEVTVAYRNADCLQFQKRDPFPENVRMRDLRKVLGAASDGSYDVVVSSFYLCSVMNVDNVLKEIRRILKSGGKFAFLEHAGFPENQMSYSLQRLVTPFWTILFDNCRLDRHVTKNLHQSSFNALTYHTFYPENRSVFHRPIVTGVCTK